MITFKCLTDAELHINTIPDGKEDKVCKLSFQLFTQYSETCLIRTSIG